MSKGGDKKLAPHNAHDPGGVLGGLVRGLIRIAYQAEYWRYYTERIFVIELRFNVDVASLRVRRLPLEWYRRLRKIVESL